MMAQDAACATAPDASSMKLFSRIDIGALKHCVIDAPTTGGFDHDGVEAIPQRDNADALAFDRCFTSTTDLPDRLRSGLPFGLYRREAFWGGEHLYNDFTRYRGG
jgi:hypothetical protein